MPTNPINSSSRPPNEGQKLEESASPSDVLPVPVGATEDASSPAQREEVFTAHQITMLEMVAAGASHAEAGGAVGRSAKTVQRLLAEPYARAYVRSAQADRLDQVVGLLGRATTGAAHVLLDELAGEEAATRLRAADLALRSFDRLREVARQEEIIETLTAQVADLRDAITRIAEEDHDA